MRSRITILILLALAAIILLIRQGMGRDEEAELDAFKAAKIEGPAPMAPGIFHGDGGRRLINGSLNRPVDLATAMKRASDEKYMDRLRRLFSGSLFIGDSRTVGIRQYSGIDTASYFCATGMGTNNLFDENQTGGGQTSLEALLTDNKYGRIFVMLGINELGFSMDTVIDRYGQDIDRIAEAQPEAEIYIMLNMHVTAARSEKDPTFNNPRIDEFNGRVRALAEERELSVIDVNPLFDDENGALNAAYTFDNTHVLGKYYKGWAAWLGSAVREDE